MSMTKSDKLEILEILSALESWGFSNKHYLPDFIIERMAIAMDKLRGEILEEI